MGKTEKLFTKNFTFLMLGQIFSLIGNYTLKFALSMYVLEQTGSASVFGTLLAIATVPAVILGPFGGVMADRLNRRNMMVALDFLSGTAVLAAFLLMGENMEYVPGGRTAEFWLFSGPFAGGTGVCASDAEW